MTLTFPFFTIAKSQAFFSQMISIIKKKVFSKIIISPIFLEQKITGEKDWEIKLDKAAEATP